VPARRTNRRWRGIPGAHRETAFIAIATSRRSGRHATGELSTFSVLVLGNRSCRMATGDAGPCRGSRESDPSRRQARASTDRARRHVQLFPFAPARSSRPRCRGQHGSEGCTRGASPPRLGLPVRCSVRRPGPKHHVAVRQAAARTPEAFHPRRGPRTIRSGRARLFNVSQVQKEISPSSAGHRHMPSSDSRRARGGVLRDRARKVPSVSASGVEPLPTRRSRRRTRAVAIEQLAAAFGAALREVFGGGWRSET